MKFFFKQYRKTVCLLTCLSVSQYCSAMSVSTGVDEEAKLPYWEMSNQGISVRLVQRLPDQTRAFFMARGFSSEHAELVAQSCVFQTVFRNTSNTSNPDSLEYNLQEWEVLQNGQIRKMKMREDWKNEWHAKKVKPSSQIAFEWALLPTRQVYRPGDYNWGMSIFNLKPGTRFDLKMTWKQYGEKHSAVIHDIRCAPDIHPES